MANTPHSTRPDSADDAVDGAIDTRLRSVPLPSGLEARVALERLFADAALDRLLVRVDIPGGLVARLRRAVGSEVEAGSTIEIQGGARLVHRATHVNRSGQAIRMPRWARSFAADGIPVALALGCVIGLFYAGSELSRRLSESSVREEIDLAGRRDFAVVDQAVADSVTPGPATPTRRHSPQPRESQEVASERLVESLGSSSDPPEAVAASSISKGFPPTAEWTAKPKPTSVRGSPAPLGSFAAGLRISAGSPSPIQHGTATAFTGMQVVPGPRRSDRLHARRAVPRVRGFDLAFEMAHGEAPFVDPSLAAVLAVDHPPLSVRTDSFDSFFAAGLSPLGHVKRRASEIESLRVEDILAAIPAVAMPTDGNWDRPRLAVQAFPSLRQSNSTEMLEFSVTVPPLNRPADQTLLVTLVLDHSACAGAPQLWQGVCRGLAMIGSQMRSGDRLSIIVCEDRPRMSAVRADAEEIKRLCVELQREQPRGTADFDAAIRMAHALSRREPEPVRLVVVANTDAVEWAQADGREALAQWQESMVSGEGEGVPQFILFSPADPLDDHASPAMPGRVAADPTAIRRAIVSGVFGRSTLVAKECRLDVQFDPKAVAAYRIVGHKHNAVESLASGAAEPITLHAGENVRVVYEVSRRGAAPGRQTATPIGSMASAVFSYVAAGGSPHTTPAIGNTAQSLEMNPGMRRTVSVVAGVSETPTRSESLPSPHACEVLLAVGLGELAGNSVYAPPRRQAIASLVLLAERWQARGDMTPTGAKLLACLLEMKSVSVPSGR